MSIIFVKSMGCQMNPIPAREVDELSKVNRQVLCEHYESCLDLALSRRWEGFSCETCGSFRAAQRPSIEWLEDALSCGNLVAVVFGFRIMP